jgi:hypothetical protein
LHRQELRATITEDFKAIPAILDQLRRTPAAVAPDVPDPPEQLALF